MYICIYKNMCFGHKYVSSTSCIYLRQRSRFLLSTCSIEYSRNSDIVDLVDNTNQSSIPESLFHIEVEIYRWLQTFNSIYPPQHLLISTVHTTHQYFVCQREIQGYPERPGINQVHSVVISTRQQLGAKVGDSAYGRPEILAHSGGVRGIES